MDAAKRGDSRDNSAHENRLGPAVRLARRRLLRHKPHRRGTAAGTRGMAGLMARAAAAVPHIRMASASDRGRLRSQNEDAVAIDETLGLLVLADGMGGHNGGEIASRIAIDTVVGSVRNALSAPPAIDAAMAIALLQTAIAAANTAIGATAQSRSELTGMGTTIVACLLHAQGAAVAHVGDSRLYQLRGTALQQWTRDHSLVEELVQRGYYASRAEASKVVGRNVVTRALGIDAAVEIDSQTLPLAAGDMLLLCSDGLTEMVDDLRIARELQTWATDLPAAAAQLIAVANTHGGKDNISVCLARVDALTA